MEKLSAADTAPTEIASEQKVDVLHRVKALAKQGEKFSDDNGWIVTFQPEALRSITCRLVLVQHDDYKPGVYVSVTTTIHENEDGTYMDHNREYNIPYDEPAFVTDVYIAYDEEGDELPYHPDTESVDERIEWMEEQGERFTRNILGQYYYQEILECLAPLSPAFQVRNEQQ
jgi:hypothetical protein